MLLLPTRGRGQHRLAVPDSPEALIREARQRTRRRRLWLAAAVAALTGIAAAAYALAAHIGPAVIPGSADSPYANARVFGGHGELAFVSRDRLWVLDGRGGVLRRVKMPRHDVASSPSFSHDGRWLAYSVAPASNHYGAEQLWIARADGSGARRVAGLRLRGLIGWSPRADVLAATVGQQLRYVPIGLPTGVHLISPDGRARPLVQAPTRPTSPHGFDAVAYDGAWSPTGGAIALVLEGPQAAVLETVPIDHAAKPIRWLSAGNAPTRVTGLAGRAVRNLVPQLAGWWSGWGIAFWLIGGGAVSSRDSTQLAVIAHPGARPHYLAQTLALDMSKEVAPGPGGRLALVWSTDNGGREYAAGKAVESCSSAPMACRPVPGAATWPGPALPCKPCFPKVVAPGKAGSGVSEDPAWSPNGSSLAYVKAPATDAYAWPSNAWFAAHAIYVWNSGTGTTRRVGKVDGSGLPTWSADGKDLMYESGDGLWLMPLATGVPVEVVHPLYSQAAWNNKISHLGSISYYGQIPWQTQFSWWSPR